MSEQQSLSFDITGIQACQRNRYPMLFIDRITECVPFKYAKGYKLFSYNEWYFHGYDIASPKVWSTIQIESMSQVFLMTFLSGEEYRGMIAVSNKFDNVRFYKKIVPGDKLEIEAVCNSFKRGIARGKVGGKVNGEPACSMDCVIVIPQILGQFQRNSEVVLSESDYKIDMPNNDLQFGINEIQECMLNKYPWQYLDRVIDIEPGKFVKAIKNFTFDEWFFPPHFPDDPSVPGFLQIETCIQSFLLTFLSLDDYKRSETAEYSLNNVQLKRKIVPGDILELSAVLESFDRGVAKGRVESFVNGEPATSLDITAVVLNEIDKFKPCMMENPK